MGVFQALVSESPPCAQGKGQLLSQLQSPARGASREEMNLGMHWGAVDPLDLNINQDQGMEYSLTLSLIVSIGFDTFSTWLLQTLVA